VVSGFPITVRTFPRRDIDRGEAEIDTSNDDQNLRYGNKLYAHTSSLKRRGEAVFLSRRTGSPNSKPHLMMARWAIVDPDMRVASFRKLIHA
jgi:hypothetical protein